MSNDLISRKSIIKKLENALLNDDLTIGEQGLLSDIVSFVAIETTAYDIDKVVSEIRRCSGNGYRDIDGDYVPPMIETNEAIEIVKQGSISDDVCEWKFESDGEFIQNPHTKRLYSNEPSMKNFYCNTCGKKIKAVK